MNKFDLVLWEEKDYTLIGPTLPILCSVINSDGPNPWITLKELKTGKIKLALKFEVYKVNIDYEVM